MATSNTNWASYEEVTKSVIEQIAATRGIATTRLERNVRLPGRASTSQIDVIWEYVSSNGRPIRVLFECRQYGRRIDQLRLHAWRSVVDDLSTPEFLTVGVMVTTIGYQVGARRVADTYRVLIYELREPGQNDYRNRIRTIEVVVVPRHIRVENFTAEAVEEYSADGQPWAALGELQLRFDDGRQVAVEQLLLDGELTHIETAPTPMHSVVRQLPDLPVLMACDEQIARVRTIRANVGEVDGAPTIARVEREVVLVIRNALTGGRLWIAGDGTYVETDS